MTQPALPVNATCWGDEIRTLSTDPGLRQPSLRHTAASARPVVRRQPERGRWRPWWGTSYVILEPVSLQHPRKAPC